MQVVMLAYVLHVREIVHNMWDDFEKHNSSTLRELKTVQVILLSLADELTCKGSMVDELHQLAMSIFGVCVKHEIL